jgi:hypothetical protein
MAKTWQWESLMGVETIEQDEAVYLDDGTDGLVEDVDFTEKGIRILVTRRKLQGTDMPDKWIWPANIVG